MGWRMAGGNCCCNCVIERDVYVETISVSPPKGTVKHRYPNQNTPFPTGVAGDFVYFDHKNRETYVTANTNLGIYKLDHAMKVRTDILTYPGGGAGTWRIRRGLCVDYDNEHVYFMASQVGSDTSFHLQRIGYDGSGETTVATITAYINPGGGTMMQVSRGNPKYVFLVFQWVDQLIATVASRLRVYRYNISNSDIDLIIDTEAPGGEVGANSSIPQMGIAVDNVRQKLYYASRPNHVGFVAESYGQIRRCDFDGDNDELIYKNDENPSNDRDLRFAGYSHTNDRIYWAHVNSIPTPDRLRWKSATAEGGDIRTVIDTGASGSWNEDRGNFPISLKLACGYEAYPVST